MVDDHTVDVPPADHMLVVRNDDRPGDDRRGRARSSATPASTSPTWTSASRPTASPALMVLAPPPSVPAEVQEQLRAEDLIKGVRSLG